MRLLWWLGYLLAARSWLVDSNDSMLRTDDYRAAREGCVLRERER